MLCLYAGHFVKKVCRELQAIFEESDREVDCNNNYEDFNVPKQDIKDLFVVDTENKKTIF